MSRTGRAADHGGLTPSGSLPDPGQVTTQAARDATAPGEPGDGAAGARPPATAPAAQRVTPTRVASLPDPGQDSARDR